MAEIQPLHALRYELTRTGGLQPVVAPPYDVIDPAQRAALIAGSPYNVVTIDLPRVAEGGAGTEGAGAEAGDGEPGEDPYAAAAATFARWQEEGIVVRDDAPALWVLEQEYTGPDGRQHTRRGFLARVRVEDYGPGRIRPHERTHPGPKEDRLRLTRATRANLSPIFSLYDDPGSAAWNALAPHAQGDPHATTRDPDGTVNRLWRVADAEAIESVRSALTSTELLIADGHHRYETARVYAREVGGEGAHNYVLMCLVALQDPGLTIFPTHRLVRGLRSDQHEALAEAIRRNFDVTELSDPAELVPRPEPGDDPARVRIGYIDAHFKRPFMLVLKDSGIAAAALPEHAEPYRRLDTAVLEAIILKGTLGLTEDDIDHLNGLGYARSDGEALALVRDGTFDAGFFMGPVPVRQVQDVSATGESMPPKSTYFFPKVPTGLVFNPLTDD